ncbi:SpoIID/LytB domain-containing protein, partial [bacterium]|nr:SpoIID/LytB domain-containing protein [bacterium]
MNKKHRHIYLLTAFFCLGLVATSSEGVTNSKDSNTAVRVLLDKAIPKGKVQSLLYSTFYRTDRGALKWTRNGQMFSVVNYLGLDDYLLGTLGSEMSPSWEIEALKAQAVASRTYALYMIKHPKHSDYDLERSTQDQVYGGVEAEHPRVREAIQATSGEVLSFKDQPIKAFFHSRCGGSTETPGFVWNHHQGYPQKKVACPYCLKNPFALYF